MTCSKKKSHSKIQFRLLFRCSALSNFISHKKVRFLVTNAINPICIRSGFDKSRAPGCLEIPSRVTGQKFIDGRKGIGFCPQKNSTLLYPRYGEQIDNEQLKEVWTLQDWKKVSGRQCYGSRNREDCKFPKGRQKGKPTAGGNKRRIQPGNKRTATNGESRKAVFQRKGRDKSRTGQRLSVKY